MQVIEDFIHIVGIGMMDFQNSYLMTGNVGKKWDFFPPNHTELKKNCKYFRHTFLSVIVIARPQEYVSNVL